MNLPNILTVSRLILAVIYFIILWFADNKDYITIRTTLLDIALGLFIAAVITDMLDGYLARRLNLVTNFGRIADPFVDKVIACGSFVFFLGWETFKQFLTPWMVVVILGREFLVSGLRSFAESHHTPFGSSVFGQNKMLIQSVTIIWAIFYAAHLQNEPPLWTVVALQSLIYVTLISTVISGFIYLYQGWHLFKTSLSQSASDEETNIPK